MKEMKTENEIRAELVNFYGTENYYQLGLYPNVVATDGIKYLAEVAHCYWLTDLIAVTLNSKSEFKDEGIVFFKLVKNDDSSMSIVVDDGNDNVLHSMVVPSTDFPMEKFTIYCQYADYGTKAFWTMMLPSEY